MSTAPAERADVGPGQVPVTAGPNGARVRTRRIGLALAGPALIVGAVLVLMRRVAFGGFISDLDVLRLWLPTYCYLGKSLAAGHVPLWNPFTMGGAPFAADPQSGWMYLPAMALFSAMGCGGAIRAMVVLQPLLAGLGLYGFCRSEGLGRAASTVGGAVLALTVCRTQLSASIPFAATLAWTAVMLAACSRFVRATTRSGRIGWTLATALAWGQLAAAHFSVGLLIGSLALVAFLVAKVVSGGRDGTWAPRPALAAIAMLFVATVAVNLAFLLPRLAYIPQTNLGLGYGRLQRLGDAIVNRPMRGLHVGASTAPAWPLAFAGLPADRLGAVALALSFGGFFSRRLRPLAVAFSAFGLLCYLLSLRWVAAHIPRALKASRVGDFYLHDPNWFGYGVLAAAAVLTALGVQAWLERRDLRSRLVLVAPAVVVWGIAPVLFGESGGAILGLLAGAAAGAVALWAAARRASLAWAIPVVLVIELVATGVVHSRTSPFGRPPLDLIPVFDLTLHASDALRPDAIDAALQRLEGPRSATKKASGEAGAPFLNSGLLFDEQTVDGYNAVQLVRTWVFVRASQGVELRYNRVLFARFPPLARDLLRIGYVIAPRGSRLPRGSTVVAGAGPVALFRLPGPAPGASLLTSWKVVPATGSAFPTPATRAILAPRFDPARRAVVEGDPGLRAARRPVRGGRASLRWRGTDGAEVFAVARAPSVALIRIPYARGWRATVDGRPAPVLATDEVDLGVPVPRGRHTIELRYVEPTIGLGLLGSAVAILLLAAGALILRRRDRRGRDAVPT